MAIVCNHCAAMEQVLTDLVGSKVSRVIMKRVENELHAQSKTPIQVLAPRATSQGALISMSSKSS
jgi:hypothetical protein